VPGDPVWQGSIDGHPVAMQVRPIPNGFRLAHQGFEVAVNVFTESEATAARLMPIATAADTGKETAVSDAGLVVSIAVTKAGGQVRRDAGGGRGDEDAERAARRTRRHGQENSRCRRRDAGGGCAHSRICLRLLRWLSEAPRCIAFDPVGIGVHSSGSVYDAISIRIARTSVSRSHVGGSVASLAVLGDPDIALITLTELAEQMRRMSRAAALPVLVDADHAMAMR